MRLINVNTLKLEEFHHKIPPYAILSHTWGSDEVTFEMYQEYLNVTNRCLCPGTNSRNSNTEEKAGFAKIKGACRRALHENLGYLWCDTNCIDKSSSAELSEAINSMYAWYRDSAVCYAYLGDVDDGKGMITEEFRKSRWFTRGWTLQELLAPKEVLFFNADWRFVGNRQRLATIICGVTKIHKGALENRDTIKDYSIAQRMSWAAGRQTSRQEDIAYCLLGIFNINMPLLYGEGSKAFDRLQEEIIKVSDDQSIFAWDFFDCQQRASVGILASSPREFASCGAVVRDRNVTHWPYAATNLGISIDLPMIHTTVKETVLVGLNCAIELRGLVAGGDVSAATAPCWQFPVWIWLRSIGDKTFTRSPYPASRSFLTNLYSERVDCTARNLYGVTSASRVEPWVSGLFSSARGSGAASAGFHVTMSFGLVRPRTNTFEKSYPPGAFKVHKVPPRGSPALSHEIISAGSYTVLLSALWDHQRQPKDWRYTILESSHEVTARICTADFPIPPLEEAQGPRVRRSNDAGPLEYCHDQIRKRLCRPTNVVHEGIQPFVRMEKDLWDDHGQVKIVVHLTFQEAIKPHHNS